jgi:hypothetical protein
MIRAVCIAVGMTVSACVLSLPAEATGGSEAPASTPCPAHSSAHASGTGTLSGGQASYTKQQSHTGTGRTSVKATESYRYRTNERHHGSFRTRVLCLRQRDGNGYKRVPGALDEKAVPLILPLGPVSTGTAE